MFFDHSDLVYSTLSSLTKRLHDAAIPYAIVGAMAVHLHGARRMTNDMSVLLTSEGLNRFRQQFVGIAYDSVKGRSRRFEDKTNRTIANVFLTGHHPGFSSPLPVAFPEPLDASEEINGIRVVNLAQLVQLKLAARRHCDSADVVFLVQTHDLDESFLEQLHPFVHRDFTVCVEETRRDKELEACS